MAKVYLGLGSNVEPQKHLRLGIEELARQFGVLELSNLYQNAAVGFDGDAFVNLVIGLESDASPLEIHNTIEEIHTLAERERGESRFAPRTLDIDLLLYDDLILNEPPLRLPRGDILKYSFVLGPLAEIAPELRHPETGRLITEHWAEFDKNSHPLLTSNVRLQDGQSENS
ncbi:MAG: 2-amino-4-hydroxy-6-hydroxymethyldihydropteridine diphosphokinase [Woeseiaceae bacterium]